MGMLVRVATLGVVLMAAACAAPPPPVASGTPPAPAPTAATESLTIEFPVAGSALSTTAQTQLDGAARLYRDARPTVMIVSGHTDKVGAEYPNLLLSARRANIVKRALVDRGVPPDRLQLVAVGAAEPSPSVTAARAVVVTWR